MIADSLKAHRPQIENHRIAFGEVVAYSRLSHCQIPWMRDVRPVKVGVEDPPFPLSLMFAS